MPTPSSTASSTTPIASISPATACDEPDQDQPQRIDPQLASRQNPPASRTPLKRATSCRNTERHDLGTTGRHRRNQHFHQLDGWIVRRLWSHRAKRWRNTGWKDYPTKRLLGEFKLVNLVSLIPSLRISRSHS